MSILTSTIRLPLHGVTSGPPTTGVSVYERFAEYNRSFTGHGHRCRCKCSTHQGTLEDFPDDAVSHLDQLHRPGLPVGGHAVDRQGVRHRSRDPRSAAQFVLLDLCLHADSRRHAGRPLRAARRDRRRHPGLGLLPGYRRGLHRLGPPVADTAGPRCGRSADLPRRRQTQRHLDDADRAWPRRDLARRRRAAGRGAGRDPDLGPDRLARVLAHGVRDCRHRHRPRRLLRLELHPQPSARTCWRQ